MRLISLVSDIFVWYHAKDLKLTEDSNDDKPDKDRERESDEGFFEPSKKDYLKFDKDSAETVPLASFPPNGDSVAMPVFVQPPNTLRPHGGHKKNASLDLRFKNVELDPLKNRTKSLPKVVENDGGNV